jgi:hypothetical protein
MRARTVSHRAQEGLAFAVRIRVRMPPEAPQRLSSDILTWLFIRFGRDGFAHRCMDTEVGPLEVFFFRQLEEAQEFLTAFPELVLANAMASETETAPVTLRGRSR